MFRRIVTTGLILLWINLNFTLFPALIFIGWANLGSADNTLGWWMIAIGATPILVYFVVIFLDGLINNAIVLANAGRSGPAPASSVIGSLLFVFGVYGILFWLLPGQLILLTSGCLYCNDPTFNPPIGPIHHTLCDVLFWPSWFF